MNGLRGLIIDTLFKVQFMILNFTVYLFYAPAQQRIKLLSSRSSGATSFQPRHFQFAENFKINHIGSLQLTMRTKVITHFMKKKEDLLSSVIQCSLGETVWNAIKISSPFFLPLHQIQLIPFICPDKVFVI